jgi:hypothetical protein
MTGQYCVGLPGAPAAADVTVTLKSYRNVDAICDLRGTVKVLTEGEGFDTPNDGAACTVSYSTSLASTGAVVDEVSDFCYETGNEVLPAGLEEVVMRMKKGEVAEAAVPADFAYGAAGKQGLSKGEVPADADVVFTITMTAFENEKETYTMVREGGGSMSVKRARDVFCVFVCARDPPPVQWDRDVVNTVRA